MKKIIQSALFLLVTGIFILGAQVSCQKSEAQTNPNQTANVNNVILYSKSKEIIVGMKTLTDSAGNSASVPCKTNIQEYYLINGDGTNNRIIPINLPSNLYALGNAFLTSDAQRIVFTVGNFALPSSVEVNNYIPESINALLTGFQVYSCTVNGSDAKKIMDIDTPNQLQDAY